MALLQVSLGPLCLGPQILPQEEDYGFDIEEKNKAVVVKSVQRGSLAEVRLGAAAMAGIVGRWESRASVHVPGGRTAELMLGHQQVASLS